MPIPPSWTCPCGVRNAGTFFHCRRCSAPRPSPARDPDEWRRIRIGTPFRSDAVRAILFNLALILAALVALLAMARGGD